MITPLDLIRFQMAATLGMIEFQRQLVTSAWQMGAWWMPPVASPNICQPTGQKQAAR
jgi:hypothetical protein